MASMSGTWSTSSKEASGYNDDWFSRKADTSPPPRRWRPTEEETVRDEVASSKVQRMPTSVEVNTSSKRVSSSGTRSLNRSSETSFPKANAMRLMFESISSILCAVERSRKTAGERVPAIAPWPSFGTTAITSTDSVVRTRWLSRETNMPSSKTSPTSISRVSAATALMAILEGPPWALATAMSENLNPFVGSSGAHTASPSMVALLAKRVIEGSARPLSAERLTDDTTPN